MKDRNQFVIYTYIYASKLIVGGKIVSANAEETGKDVEKAPS